MYFVNRGYYHLIGYTKEEYEALGQSLVESLMYSPDLGLNTEGAGQMERSGHASSEYRIVRRDGQLVWIKMDASKMDIDGQPMVFATFMDVTEGKAAATQLDLISDHVSNGVSILEIKNGREIPLYTNNAFFEMLGVPREEYLRDPAHYHVNAVSTEDRTRVEAAVKPAAALGEGGQVEYWLNRPDGSRLYVARTFTTLPKDEAGSFLLLSVTTDMTQQKRTEERPTFERAQPGKPIHSDFRDYQAGNRDADKIGPIHRTDEIMGV